MRLLTLVSLAKGSKELSYASVAAGLQVEASGARLARCPSRCPSRCDSREWPTVEVRPLGLLTLYIRFKSDMI